jgi:hypothetical protein
MKRRAAGVGGTMKRAAEEIFTSVFRNVSAGIPGLFWHPDRMAQE